MWVNIKAIFTIVRFSCVKNLLFKVKKDNIKCIVGFVIHA